jgi:hypothetical protein
MLCNIVNTQFFMLILMYNHPMTIIAIQLSIVWGLIAAAAEAQNENYYLIPNNRVGIAVNLGEYDAWSLERCVAKF